MPTIKTQDESWAGTKECWSVACAAALHIPLALWAEVLLRYTDDLSTHISSAEWITPLSQFETTAAEMTPEERWFWKRGVPQITRATWVKQEGQKWEKLKREGDGLLKTGTS